MLSRIATFLMFLIVVLPSQANAAGRKAKFNRVVAVGAKAPEWKNLIGVDDKEHSLADHKKAQIVVLVFTCNHCPVASAYNNRLIKFANEYAEKSVEMVAISVSLFPQDRFEKMKGHAKQEGFNFPYLHDESQQIGKAYGATCTPHFFVLDKERSIAYMGRFDDNINLKKVKHHYLRDAVDALLAGEQPEVLETRQSGCEIDYELSETDSP